MSIQKWIEQQKKEGNFQMDVVYANIGNNTDELILCTAKEADDAGCVIVDVTYIVHNAFYTTAIITAEVV